MLLHTMRDKLIERKKREGGREGGREGEKEWERESALLFVNLKVDDVKAGGWSAAHTL